MATLDGIQQGDFGFVMPQADPPVQDRGGVHHTGIAEDLMDQGLPAGVQLDGYLAEPYFDGGSQSAPDTLQPVVGNFSPAAGGQLAIGDPISFDVTDLGSTALVLVYVEYADIGISELAYDGQALVAPYTQSTITPITNGSRFSIKRTGGWRNNPNLRVSVADASGNITVT